MAAATHPRKSNERHGVHAFWNFLTLLALLVHRVCSLCLSSWGLAEMVSPDSAASGQGLPDGDLWVLLRLREDVRRPAEQFA